MIEYCYLVFQASGQLVRQYASKSLLRKYMQFPKQSRGTAKGMIPANMELGLIIQQILVKDGRVSMNTAALKVFAKCGLITLLAQTDASSPKAFCLSSQDLMKVLTYFYNYSFFIFYCSFFVIPLFYQLDCGIYSMIIDMPSKKVQSLYDSASVQQILIMQERNQEECRMYEELGQPQLITIDEKWIAKDTFLKVQLITCPVCYCIPLDYPRQCQKCERIFCHTDYEIIANGDSKCPNCKAQPWVAKKDIHISYKHMFDSLVFVCNLCTNSKTEYRKSELIHHLEDEHNRYLSDESILYDYAFVNQKGQELKLNLTQNIEINFKKNDGLSKFQIAGASGRVLSIDLKDMTANHHQLGKCKVTRQRSKTIKKNHQYIIWIVNISDPDENDQRIVFYSEQLQQQIEKNYQDFEKNERLNQFCMDVRQTRYRISFVAKSQINTYTRAEKRIMRLPVIFR